MARIYTKNGFAVCRELPESESTTAGGIVLLSGGLKVSAEGHEVEVVEAKPEYGLNPGDRVIISVRGISAFHRFEGADVFSLPEREIWARVVAGDVVPRHGQLLTERDDAAMHRYAFGDSALVMPEVVLAHGQSASGDDDPRNGGARTRDSVTLLYERVVRRGPEVLDGDLVPGRCVAFSPSYCSTRLQRLEGLGRSSRTRHFHLVPADEVLFVVAEG